MVIPIYKVLLYFAISVYSMLRTRHKLCRRRLEDAHIKYAILCTVAHYEDVFVKDDMVVSKFTSKYYSGFQA